MRRLVFVPLACLWAGVAGGEVPFRDVDSIAQILPTLDSTTLLVLDLDNTVLEPTQILGSDQWYRYLVRRFQARGVAQPAARAIAVWNRVQHRIQVRPVEADTPRLLREQQDRGVRTLGLTARSIHIARRTLEQLEAIGVRLHRRTLKAPKHPLYRGGVLFAGEGRDKGVLLVNYLRHVRVRPGRVVFVDDRLENVRDVARALSKARLPMTVYRYAGTDKRVRAFEADFADTELLVNGVETRQ